MGMFDNDFLSGIENVVKDAAGSVAQDAGQFFKSTVKDTLVRIGPKPAGNLSPEELAQGYTGYNPDTQVSGRDVPDAGALSNALTYKIAGIPVIPLLAVGFLSAFLLLKRRR